MNIHPINNSNVSFQGNNRNPNWIKRHIRRFGQKILDMSPSHTSNDTRENIKKWNKTSNWVSHPMWNRGIMGATALLTQPTIDYYNHRVDEETRTISRNRTIAKILAGTLVGMFIVRGPVHKIVTKMTDIESKKKYSHLLLPQKYFKKLRENDAALVNYRSTLSMLLALGAMSITNFILDAPLTIILTNLFNEKTRTKHLHKTDLDNLVIREVNNV